MKEFLQKILSAVLDSPEGFEIKEEQQPNLTTYTIYVAEENIGRVLGKEGKVIRAIRSLCRLKAGRQQQVFVKVETLS